MDYVTPSDLFDAVPPGHLARRADPETSQDAARSLGHKAGWMRRGLLGEFFDGPRTSEEAAHAAHLDPWQASKRTSDLLNLGYLEPTGDVRTGHSGRKQRVLRMTYEGVIALRAAGAIP